MSHSTLEVFYKDTFSLVHRKKFASITAVENMIPFERDIYVAMIKDDEEKEAERKRQEAAVREALSKRGY